MELLLNFREHNGRSMECLQVVKSMVLFPSLVLKPISLLQALELFLNVREHINGRSIDSRIFYSRIQNLIPLLFAQESVRRAHPGRAAMRERHEE